MRKFITFMLVLLLGTAAFARPIGSTRIGSIDLPAGSTFVQVNGGFNVGVDDTGYDATFFGATSGDYALFDASGDELLFVSGYDAQWDDSSLIRLGSAANGDVTLQFDGTTFEIFANAADTPLELGTVTAGFDVNIPYETAGNIYIDYDGDDITLSDEITLQFGDSGDITVNFGGSDFKIDAITADEGFLIGDTTTGFDVTYSYETAGTITTDYDSNEISLSDDVELIFGTGDDVSLIWDTANFELKAAAADTPWSIGNQTTGFDITYDYETSGNITVDYDSNEITLTDDIELIFGSSDDVSFIWDTANFEIKAAAADTPLVIGDIAAGFDITYDFETAGQFRTDYDGDFINLTDDMDLRFGTGASADGDFQISSSSGNVLTIGQVVSGTGTVAVGVDGKGLDTTFYVEKAGDYIKVDQANDELEFVGSNINLDADSGIIAAAVVLADSTPQDLDPNDSGKTHVIVDLSQNSRFDLPPEADGLHYRFIYCGAAAEAHDHTIDSENDTNYFIGGVGFLDNDAGPGALEVSSVYSDGDSNSKLTINNAAGGTAIEMYCDGTNWYVSGTVVSDTAPAFADQ